MRRVAVGAGAVFAAGVAALAVVGVRQHVPVERSVVVAPRTLSRGCRAGAEPDSRCTPGAFNPALTRAVICSATFRTRPFRHVTEGEKHAVERSYGMAPKGYGHTIELDHLIPIELGGSNAVANIWTEPGAGKWSYHLKDKLENRLHEMVCAKHPTITLHAAQVGIATDWEGLYVTVFGPR